MRKLYVLVRKDLSKSQRAVQACHAAVEFMLAHQDDV
jgi:peptidyl-tRNA hydrolase